MHVVVVTMYLGRTDLVDVTVIIWLGLCWGTSGMSIIKKMTGSKAKKNCLDPRRQSRKTS